jgi:hypothetical protein
MYAKNRMRFVMDLRQYARRKNFRESPNRSIRNIHDEIIRLRALNERHEVNCPTTIQTTNLVRGSLLEWNGIECVACKP